MELFDIAKKAVEELDGVNANEGVVANIDYYYDAYEALTVNYRDVGYMIVYADDFHNEGGTRLVWVMLLPGGKDGMLFMGFDMQDPGGYDNLVAFLQRVTAHFVRNNRSKMKPSDPMRSFWNPVLSHKTWMSQEDAGL